MKRAPWRYGRTWDGLTLNSTWRERRHYRRNGVWPASYLQRTIAQYGGSVDRETADAVADLAKLIVGEVREGDRR